MSYDSWATLKIVALRMDALTQLSGQWLRRAPLSGCDLPPVPMNSTTGDDKKDCVKFVKGDEAGTLSGTPSSVGVSTPCAAVSMSVALPPPTPN